MNKRELKKKELRDAFIARQKKFLEEDPQPGDDMILEAAIKFYDFGVEDAETAMKENESIISKIFRI